MRCPQCNREYAEDAEFCTADGSRLADAKLVTRSGDPFVGKVIDSRFRVEARIGTGGMGAVYRARQLNANRDVAVKILHLATSQDEEAVRRFQVEADIISRLRHPNTLKLFEMGWVDERLYIVTEMLQGAPLDEVIDSEGKQTVERTFQILEQVCGALIEAHAEGIVHRDLKPGNIFIEQVAGQEVVKVLDFGIAKLTDSTTATQTGTIIGTPAYMSPEQARGASIDHRSDLYSLGAVAYECLSGEPPFQGTTPLSVMLRHISEAPLSLLVQRPALHVHPEVDAFVLKLLSKEPNERPADATTVRDLVRQLRHHIHFHPADAIAEKSMGRRANGLETDADAPLLVTRPAWRPFAIGAAALCLAVGGWWIVSGPSSDPETTQKDTAHATVTQRPVKIVMDAGATAIVDAATVTDAATVIDATTPLADDASIEPVKPIKPKPVYARPTRPRPTRPVAKPAAPAKPVVKPSTPAKPVAPALDFPEDGMF